MIYNLANWLTQKNISMWKWVWNRGFLVLLILAIPVGYISLILFMLSLILYVFSIVTILEGIATSMFQYFRAKMKEAGLFGKIVYFPLFLLSIVFCGIVLIISIGSAMGNNSSNQS